MAHQTYSGVRHNFCENPNLNLGFSQKMMYVFGLIKRDITTEQIATFTPEFLKGIEHFRQIAGNRCSNGYVLYNGHEQYTLKGIRVFNPFVHKGLKTCMI